MTAMLPCLILLIALIPLAGAGNSTRASNASLAECPAARNESYHARLDVYYLYLIEWHSENALDLDGIERAITSGLAEVLSDCDSLGRPKYALYKEKGVAVSHEEGVCSSTQKKSTTECRILRGTASILLDTNADHVEQLAYLVIGRVLGDTKVLEEYTAMKVARAELLQAVGDNLIILAADIDRDGEDSTNASAVGSGSIIKAALTSAAVSFVFTIGIAYIMFTRRRNAVDETFRAKSRHFRMHGKHRRFFQELHDEESNALGLPSEWTIANSDLRSPSITWSVSDLTSDSFDDTQSIRSSLPLDRIIEAITEEEIASNESAERNVEGKSRTKDGNPGHHIRVHRHAAPSMTFERFIAVGGSPPQSSVCTSDIIDVSLSVSPPSTPSDDEPSLSECKRSYDLESITVTLEGCQYLDNDVETSDEVDCSFNSDPTYGLDIIPCKLSLVESQGSGLLDLTMDDDLLFSDDDLDMLKLGLTFEQEWSNSEDMTTEADESTIKKSVEGDSSQQAYSILHMIKERAERAKMQKLLTYSS